jgi:hypothetical protein
MPSSKLWWIISFKKISTVLCWISSIFSHLFSFFKHNSLKPLLTYFFYILCRLRRRYDNEISSQYLEKKRRKVDFRFPLIFSSLFSFSLWKPKNDLLLILQVFVLFTKETLLILRLWSMEINRKKIMKSIYFLYMSNMTQEFCCCFRFHHLEVICIFWGCFSNAFDIFPILLSSLNVINVKTRSCNK